MNKSALVSLTIICVLGFSGCEKAADSKKPRAEKRAVNVISTQVKAGALPHEITAVGHAEALQTVEVRPQISAQISRIHFKEGDSVKAGQLLLR